MKVVNLSDYQVFSGEKMKKNNIFQSPRFFCDVYCFEPGQEQKGHIHGDQDKVYLVLEGQGTFQVGSEKQVLGAGQGTMAPARPASSTTPAVSLGIALMAIIFAQKVANASKTFGYKRIEILAATLNGL